MMTTRAPSDLFKTIPGRWTYTAAAWKRVNDDILFPGPQAGRGKGHAKLTQQQAQDNPLHSGHLHYPSTSWTWCLQGGQIWERRLVRLSNPPSSSTCTTAPPTQSQPSMESWGRSRRVYTESPSNSQEYGRACLENAMLYAERERRQWGKNRRDPSIFVIEFSKQIRLAKLSKALDISDGALLSEGARQRTCKSGIVVHSMLLKVVVWKEKYGIYSKGNSSYVEVETFRSDSYGTFVSKAAN